MQRRCLTLFAAVAVLAGCNSAPDRTAKEFMISEVQPTAEIYWDSVQYISDETGDHDIFPRTDAEWQKVADAAVRLADLGRELKEPELAEGRGKGWIDFADGLIEVAGQAEAAARAKDTDAVFEVGGTVYSVCSACHQAYPPAEPEGESQGDAAA